MITGRRSAVAVAKAPHVASVLNPLTPEGASALSKDQSTGYLSVTLGESPGALSVSEARTIIDAANPAKAVGLEVQTGGQLGQKVSKPSTEISELIGIVAAMAILTFAFGTIAAMLLPILNAILALLTSLAIIRLLGHATTVPSVAPTLATMIGLGVGIDYALFIVTRHFRGIGDGLHYDESIARAAATSGGAVLFAGGHQRARDHLRGVHHGVRVRQLRAQRRSDHQEFGIGLAVAVILDATVVRCLLVPALMLLMGRVNWWMRAGWGGSSRTRASRAPSSFGPATSPGGPSSLRRLQQRPPARR